MTPTDTHDTPSSDQTLLQRLDATLRHPVIRLRVKGNWGNFRNIDLDVRVPLGFILLNAAVIVTKVARRRLPKRAAGGR